MKKNGPKHNNWNDFYEAAWYARKKLMSEIIEAGERDPLRVINMLEHKLTTHVENITHSPEKVTVTYDKQQNFLEEVTNIKKENGRLKLDVNSPLPNNEPLKVPRPFFDNNYNVSPYTVTDTNRFIADYVMDNNFDAIIELGSGFCQNLVKLHYLGIPKLPLYGLEYTTSGVDCGNMLATLASTLKLESLPFDYNAPDFTALKGLFSNVFVFTKHSIEQVPLISSHLLTEISRIADQVTCMHLEPFGFQVFGTEQTCIDNQQKQFFKEKGWNTNLALVLLKEFLEDSINLTYLNKHVFGGDFSNPTSLAIWKSK